jgi:hypothetical protein
VLNLNTFLLSLLLLLPQAMSDVAKQGLYPNPLVTELVPLGSGADRFWAGEDYHQNYYADNPGQGYCRAVVAPKVAKFRWVCKRGQVGNRDLCLVCALCALCVMKGSY